MADQEKYLILDVNDFVIGCGCFEPSRSSPVKQSRDTKIRCGKQIIFKNVPGNSSKVSRFIKVETPHV